MPEHCIKVAPSSIQNGPNVSRSHTIGCVYCDRVKNSISSFLDRPSCNPAVGSFANDQALTGRNQPIQGQPCLSDQGRAVARVVDAILLQRRHSPRLRNRSDPQEFDDPIANRCALGLLFILNDFARYRGPFDPFVDLLVDLLLGSGPKSAVVHVDALLDVGTTAGPVTSRRSNHRQEHWA